MRNVALSMWMALLVCGFLLTPLAHAHSEKPRHGGQVVEAGDLHVELLVKDGQVLVYVSDHGKPLPLSGASGRLVTLGQAGRHDVDLAVRPDAGALSVAVPPSLKAGDKLVVMLNLSGRKPIQARFVMR